MRFTLTLYRVAFWMISISIMFVAFENASAATEASEGTVYAMTNKAEGNSVLVYKRASNGTLTRVQEALTQGLGTGVTQDPLMSQGAVALRADGKILLAVNPASGDLTAFKVTSAGLAFGSKVPSGGFLPVSVTVYGDIVYVLNQLGIANISGFTVTDSGQLQAIASSTRELAGGALALPAQVSFTPDGTQLIVTEKGTHLIDTFAVLSDGTTSGPTAQTSAGKTPFGFAFGPSGSVVVSEAENRLPLAATASSYSITGGPLDVVSPAVPNKQTAACWVVITGHVAWVVNTLTSTISSYELLADGSLSLRKAVAASTGTATTPIDAAAAGGGQYLYVLKSATGEIAAFKISGTSLSLLFTQTGLPLSIQGIAAR